MRYEAKTFSEQTVDLDGNQYIGCTFERCMLVFRGAEPLELSRNRFLSCRWQLAGAAELTVAFLKALYHGGARDLVENTFDVVRQPYPDERGQR